MPSKKLLIITALLVIGALAVTFADQQEENTPQDPRLGEKVYAGSIQNIDKMIITKGSKTLNLVKKDGWHLGSAAGFPVDADKILKFYDRLKNVELVRRVTDKEEQFAEFGLDNPTQISLMQGEQQVLDLRVGKRREGGGVYVAMGGEYKGYLADPEVEASPDESSWELRNLVDIPGDEVKRVEFLPRDGEPVTLSREEKSADLKVEGLSETQEEVGRMATAQATLLKELKFQSRYDIGNAEASAALTNPSVVRVETFSGRQFEIHTGNTGGEKPKHFLSITVQGGGDEDQAANARINRVMNGWRFEVAGFQSEKFVKNRAAFVKAKTAVKGATSPGKG